MRLVLLPLLAPLFVLLYGVLFLSTAPATTNTFIPYALVTGPVALLGFFLLGTTSNLLWVILVGTYALYLVYALLLRFLSRRRSLGAPLTWIAVFHAACGMAFMFLSLKR